MSGLDTLRARIETAQELGLSPSLVISRIKRLRSAGCPVPYYRQPRRTASSS